MAYINDYSFSRTHNSNGTPTRWFSVLKLLNERGPLSKREILFEIYGKIYEDFNWTSSWSGNTFNTMRGYCSKMFACMNEDNIVVYNTHTRKWETGYIGRTILALRHEI